jgi:hypothetical protein
MKAVSDVERNVANTGDAKVNAKNERMWPATVVQSADRHFRRREDIAKQLADATHCPIHQKRPPPGGGPLQTWNDAIKSQLQPRRITHERDWDSSTSAGRVRGDSQ